MRLEHVWEGKIESLDKNSENYSENGCELCEAGKKTDVREVEVAKGWILV